MPVAVISATNGLGVAAAGSAAETPLRRQRKTITVRYIGRKRIKNAGNWLLP
jgi:hypothetical protein